MTADIPTPVGLYKYKMFNFPDKDRWENRNYTQQRICKSWTLFYLFFSFLTSHILIFSCALDASELTGVSISQSVTSFRQLSLFVPIYM